MLDFVVHAYNQNIISGRELAHVDRLAVDAFGLLVDLFVENNASCNIDDLHLYVAALVEGVLERKKVAGRVGIRAEQDRLHLAVLAYADDGALAGS